MRTFFNKPVSLVLLLSFFVFSSGCDSNKDEEVGNSFDQMGSMISTAFGVFGSVAGDILLNSVNKSQPIYDCDQSGTVDYSPTGTPDEYSLVLDGCNGIDGNVDLGLTTSVTENGVNFSMSLDGSLTEACSMTLNNFSMNVVSSQSGESTVVLDGTLSSTCNDEAFSCSFNNADLTNGTENTLVQESCTTSAG